MPAINVQLDQKTGENGRSYRVTTVGYAAPGAGEIEGLGDVDDAITTALGNAAPDFDSTADIEAIQTAVGALTVGAPAEVGNISLVFDGAITSRNQIRAAIREIERAILGLGSLTD